MPPFFSLLATGCRAMAAPGRLRRILAAGVALALCMGLLAVARDLPGPAAARYGPQAVRMYQEWTVLLNRLRDSPDPVRLGEVNQFMNRRLRFADDQTIWHQADYWPTPLETFGKGAANCQGFTIAKYFSLRLAGVAPDKLRLTYVKARIGGPDSSISQAHMVLAYYPTPTAEPLILDNLITSILPASQRPDLTPVFAFDAERLWVGSTRTTIDKLTRWRQVLDKMRAEGFTLP